MIKRIYQITERDPEHDYRFMGLDYVQKKGITVTRADYDLIYTAPLTEKDTLDPNAIKFSNEESKQTYAISIKVPAIQVEFRRMLPFEDDNGGKLSYTLNGTLYPDEQVVIYDIGDVKPETEKKRRGRRKKSEIEAEQKEN